ncbi:MAG: hemerythrin family protein [Rhodospirillales bacterium]|nr:hemerythrin family protein [Rhodospirillales bacterium]
MTFLSWSEAYALQVGALDTDHQTIIEAISALHDTRKHGDGDTEFEVALARLQEGIQEHFDREEALMKEQAYPYHAAHKEQHRQLNRDIYAVRKLHAADSESVDLDIFMAFLEAWWHQHILRSDAIFVSYLSGAKHPTRPGPTVDPIPDGLESILIEDDDALQMVSVQVPQSALDVIFTCARLLRRGGSEADAIREIADPFATMTLQEAAIVAKALMR